MKRFVLRRLGYAALTLVLLSLTIFLLVRVTGDPTVLLVEPGASRADIDALRQDLGLDRSYVVQYASFVKDVVKGDFGRSFYYRTPVLELYLSRLPNSLLLAAAAMAFSLLIGIPSGIIAAVRVNGWWDSAGKIFALLGLSMPSFWVGRLLYEGISFRDFPVVQAPVLMNGAMVIVVSLVVDILYAVVDPRIRYER